MVRVIIGAIVAGANVVHSRLYIYEDIGSRGQESGVFVFSITNILVSIA